MENKLKRGLGRGLSSLLGDSSSRNETKKVYVNDLIRNQFQPRKYFNKESLEELAQSIKEQGVIQPIVVRPSKESPNKYEIIAGERRWIASQKAGLQEVPVIVSDADDLKSLEVAIVENVQRKDLNAIEEAQGYQRLIDDFSYDQEKVARFIGKSRSHVSNSIRLLSLPTDVVELIQNDKLSQGHGKVLVGLENSSFLAKKFIEKKLSVRQAESLTKIFKLKKGSIVKFKDPNLNEIEKSLSDKIGLNVLIKNKKNNSGTILFEYKDNEQLNKLIEVIKNNY